MFPNAAMAEIDINQRFPKANGAKKLALGKSWSTLKEED